MKISIEGFQGEFPRVGEQMLPDNAAASTDSPRLLSGNLVPWDGSTQVEPLVVTDDPNAIYLMDEQYWLQWQDSELGAGQINVDVARGPIAQDTTERTVFTGTDVPRVTNIALATTGVGKYPIDSYKLGVPAPASAPSLVINQGTVSETEIALENGNAEGGNTTGWTSVIGDFSADINGTVPGFNAFEGNYYFSGGTAAVTEVYQVLPDAFPGQTLTVTWQQAAGANDSTARVSLVYFNSSAVEIGRYDSDDTDVDPDLTWEERSFGDVVPDNAASIRLYLRFTRVGAGDNDAYIDAITIEGTDFGFTSDGSTLDDFVYVRRDGNSFADVVSSMGFNPAPAIRLGSRRNSAVSIYRDSNFNLNPVNTLQFDFVRRGVSVPSFCVLLGASAAGSGNCIEFTSGAINLRDSSSWTGDNALISTIDTSVPTLTDEDIEYRVSITATRGTLNSYAVDIQVFSLPGLVEIINTTTNIAAEGDFFGFKVQHGGSISTELLIDNIQYVAASEGAVLATSNIFTSYVYTYVNGFGEEGPPSPASRIVIYPTDGSITVTTNTVDPDSEYNILTKRIYRAVSAGGVTSFLFVDEIPLATADYEDDTDIEDLGEELQTVDWDLPPSDGAGVIALPNGVTCMFSKNQLCPSVINRLHAYPVTYRLNFDSDVVAIGSIDTTVVVATETYPYLVLGSDPADMSSAKLEQRQACVSKRSMVTIRSVGVVYASPDGLVAINGAGGLQVITNNWISRKEWQDLNPSSIIGVVHDDMYFGFYNNGSFGAFLFDPKQGGNGWTMLNFEDHFVAGVRVTAGYSDPISDTFYYALCSGTGMSFDGDIKSWDTDENNPWFYDWRSKRFRLPRPASFRAAQLRGLFNGSVTFNLYEHDTLIYTRTINSETEFVLPDQAYTETSVELTGSTSEIYQIQIAEEIEELT